MKFALILLIVIFSGISYADVTATYSTQQAVPVGEFFGEITGEIDFDYKTGGAEWKGIAAKFKSVDGVLFEPRWTSDGNAIILYDRSDSKIKAYKISDGSEIANNTDITNTFFTGKGKR